MADTNAIRAGSAYVELFAKDGMLDKGLAAARRKMIAWADSVEAIGRRLLASGAAILTPLLTASIAAAETGRELYQMSLQTDTAASSLSSLAVALRLTGAGLPEVGSGLQNMAGFLEQAAAGGEQANRILNLLGVTIGQLLGRGSEQQLDRLAEGLGRLSAGRRLTFARQIFGRTEGTHFAQLTAGGAAGLRERREQAQQSGMDIPQEDIVRLNETSQALTRLKDTVSRLFVSIGSALAPAVTSIANKISEIALRASNWINANRALVVSIATVTAAVVFDAARVYAAGIVLRRILIPGVFLAANAFMGLVRAGQVVVGALSAANAVLGMTGIVSGAIGAVLGGLRAAFVALRLSAIASAAIGAVWSVLTGIVSAGAALMTGALSLARGALLAFRSAGILSSIVGAAWTVLTGIVSGGAGIMALAWGGLTAIATGSSALMSGAWGLLTGAVTGGSGVMAGAIAGLKAVVLGLYAVITAPLTLAVAALAGLAVGAVYVARLGNETMAAHGALVQYAGSWSDLADRAMGAWSSIIESIQEGNLQGAMDVAMAALKLAWVQTTGFFLTQWLDFKYGFLQGWDSIGTVIARVGVDAFHGWRLIIEDLIHWISLGFSNLFAMLEQGWNTIKGSIREVAARATAWLNGESGDTAAARVREETEAESGRIEQNLAGRNRILTQDHNRAENRIVRERNEQIAGINQVDRDIATRRRAERNAEMEPHNARLREAQDELEGARFEADIENAMSRAARQNAGQPTVPAPNLVAASNVGTFSSARAEQALGTAGGPAERTARNTETLVDLTRRLLEQQRFGGQVFA